MISQSVRMSSVRSEPFDSGCSGKNKNKFNGTCSLSRHLQPLALFEDGKE